MRYHPNMRPPVQPSRGVPFPISVAWHFHERAWSQYAAFFGRSESAQQIAERGGFSAMELVMLLLAKNPARASERPTDAEIAAVRAEIEAYDSELAAERARAASAEAERDELRAQYLCAECQHNRARADAAEAEAAKLRAEGAELREAARVVLIYDRDRDLVCLNGAPIEPGSGPFARLRAALEAEAKRAR